MASHNYNEYYARYCKQYSQWYMNWLNTNFTGPVNAHGYRLYGLPEPQCPSEAATKQYVDSKCQQADRSGTQILTQSRTESQKVTAVTFAQLANLTGIILSLTNLSNLNNRLISYFVQNVTNTGFEVVTQMEANVERFVVLSDNFLPLPKLLSIAGNPAVVYNDESNNVLLRSSDNLGKGHLTNITPASNIGTDVAVIGGKPASAYLKNATTLVYTRSSNANGTGTWNEVEIDILISSRVLDIKITELNGGPFIMLAYIHIFNKVVLSLINSAADGSDPWTYTNTGLVPYSEDDLVSELISIASIGNIPAIAYINNENPSNLMYATSNSPDGSGSWISRSFEEFNASIYKSIDLLEVAGLPAIAQAVIINSDPSLSEMIIAMTFANNKQEIIASSGSIDGSLSADIIDGNPAVAYTVKGSDTIPPNTVLKFSRANNSNPEVNPTIWSEQLLAQFNTPPISFGNVSLATISGNPAIVYSAGGLIYYIRAGNVDRFIMDTEYRVNWTL